MDLTFFTNGWSVLALFVICWCVNELIKNIAYSIMVIKSMKQLKDIPDEQREMIIKHAMKKDIPILGICRGMQALNVFCGGSLIQDIPSEIGAAEIHSSENENAVFHNIQISKSSPLSKIMGFGSHRVNSYHHQAVKKLAPGFSIAASAADGIVEAIFCPSKKFVLGIQWHPERDIDAVPENTKIISAFIKICTDNERRTI